MNMFLREMKAHRTGLIWWSLGMVALVSSGMAKYAAYETAGQSIVAIFETLPKAVLVVFGMQGFDLTKASGFYGVLFLYVITERREVILAEVVFLEARTQRGLANRVKALGGIRGRGKIQFDVVDVVTHEEASSASRTTADTTSSIVRSVVSISTTPSAAV